jgi:drug/metabolite transporter (DMT)-like permease
MRRDPATIIALVAVQVFFGLHYFAAKEIVREIPPAGWAAVRAAAAAVFLLGLALALRRPLPRRPRTIVTLAGLSVLGVIVNQFMFVKGIALTQTNHSALINSNIPVLTLGFAVLMGHERLSRRKLLSVALGLVGVLILLRVETLSFDLSDEILRGDLYTLINATSFSLFLVLSRPVLRELSAIGSSAVLFLFGAAGLMVLGGPSLAEVDLAVMTPRAWVLAAFIVVFPTAGAYLLQFFALRRVESSLVALFIYLQFIIAATVAALFLDEPAGPRLTVAALLVLAALTLRARRPGGRPASAAPGP